MLLLMDRTSLSIIAINSARLLTNKRGFQPLFYEDIMLLLAVKFLTKMVGIYITDRLSIVTQSFYG
jgi:hypothetical protein